MSNTFATLEVSQSVYDEIAAKMKDAGYDHAFVDGAIDMHGIGLVVQHSLEPGDDQGPSDRISHHQQERDK